MYQTINLPNGGTVEVWVNPPAPETHKKVGITKTEWMDKVLTEPESAKITKAESFIDGDLSWIAGGSVAIDDTIDIDDHPLLANYSGMTYRDVLRRTLKSFDVASNIDIDNRSLQGGVYILSIVGLLDSPSRAPIILQGVPL